jgi:Amt family ammonium transporter
MTPPIPAAIPAPLPDSTLTLVFVLLMLAPLAIGGLALVNTGLSRSRSAAQSILGSLVVLAVAVIWFVVLGSVFAGEARPVVLSLAGKPWDLLGLGPWFPRAFRTLGPLDQLKILFEVLGVAFLGLIPWGAGSDRLRLSAGGLIAGMLAIVVFPLAAHWVWGGGWLAQLGVNFGIAAGFLDPAGTGLVHALGGIAALLVIWITGPRRGKFPREGLATAMPAHNAAYVLFGCFIALVGWLAWNAAGAILWLHNSPASLPVTAINTLLAGAGAVLATLTVTRFRFGKPDASLCANGFLAGLVTSSACAPVVSPLAALFTGVVAGIFIPLLVEVLELAVSIDDPTGAIAVHGAAGLWGLFAAGLFAPQHGEFLAQMVGIAALLGFFLPLLYGMFAVANRVLSFHTDPDGERLGMDLHELGGAAYPEFVIHRDDSYR